MKGEVYLFTDYKLILHFGADIDGYFSDTSNSTFNKLMLDVATMFAGSKIEKPEDRVFFQNPSRAKKYNVEVNTIQKALWNMKRLSIVSVLVDEKTKERKIIVNEKELIKWLSTLPSDEMYKKEKRGSRLRRFCNRRIFSIIERIADKLLEVKKDLDARKKDWNKYCRDQAGKFIYIAPPRNNDTVAEAINVVKLLFEKIDN